MTDQEIIDLHDSMFVRVVLEDDVIGARIVRFARAVIAAQLAAPEGWKLVPCELTPAMRDAWDAAPFSEDLDEEIQAAYRAMIAASPQMTSDCA